MHVVYSVFFIGFEGRTLVSDRFTALEVFPDEQLLGGLITALQGVANELTQDSAKIKLITMGDLHYHIREFLYYRIVIATGNTKPPDKIIHFLNLRFNDKYQSELIDENMNVGVYQPFKSTIRTIIKQNALLDESRKINPNMKLGINIINLSPNLQVTALAIMGAKASTLDEIAMYAEESIEITSQNISILQEMEYIGFMRDNQNTTIYFIAQ